MLNRILSRNFVWLLIGIYSYSSCSFYTAISGSILTKSSEKLAQALDDYQVIIGSEIDKTSHEYKSTDGYKNDLLYAQLVHKTSKMILEQIHLCKDPNAYTIETITKNKTLIKSILEHFDMQIDCIKKQSFTNAEKHALKIQFTHNLITQYQSHLNFFSSVEEHIVNEMAIKKQEEHVQRIIFASHFTQTTSLCMPTNAHTESISQELIEKNKKEYQKKHKKELRKIKKIAVANAKSEPTLKKKKLFPILAITCGLSNKRKSSNREHAALATAPSSYHTLHIIAGYLGASCI
jgi:hypothetical protein